MLPLPPDKPPGHQSPWSCSTVALLAACNRGDDPALEGTPPETQTMPASRRTPPLRATPARSMDAEPASPAWRRRATS